MYNEMQAYLMFTREPSLFRPDMVGMTQGRLTVLQGRFLAGMPAGWLRECAGELSGYCLGAVRHRLFRQRFDRDCGTDQAAALQAKLLESGLQVAQVFVRQLGIARTWPLEQRLRRGHGDDHVRTVGLADDPRTDCPG